MARVPLFVLLLFLCCGCSLVRGRGEFDACSKTADCTEGRGWCDSGVACVESWCRRIPGVPCSHVLACDEVQHECLHVECVSDRECDDGLFCTGTERCVAGECIEGENNCEAGICDELKKTCTWPVRMWNYMHRPAGSLGGKVESEASIESLGSELVGPHNVTPTPAPTPTPFFPIDLANPTVQVVVFILLTAFAALLIVLLLKLCCNRFRANMVRSQSI